jgi:L,D-transpeptidase catalytic domain
MPPLSRRDFLKLGGAALAASAWPAVAPALAAGPGEGLPPEDGPRTVMGLGRVLNWGTAIRAEPTKDSPVNETHTTEDILPIYGTATDPDETRYNRIWYVVPNGYVYSGVVQPVADHINPIPPLGSIADFPFLAEVTVPYSYARFGPEDRGNWAYTLYYQTTHWVHDLIEGRDGLLWYKILDDDKLYYYSVRAAHMRRIQPLELLPIMPSVADKRIEINLKQQQLTCYVGDRQVMTTRVATGAGGFATPKGDWEVRRKRPSRHMASDGEDAAAGPGYDLIGVPWVSYFLAGISFHGTYWHNDYGEPRSHGCVNMTPSAARWLYRWSEPHLDFGLTQSAKPENGTPVHVF